MEDPLVLSVPVVCLAAETLASVPAVSSVPVVCLAANTLVLVPADEPGRAVGTEQESPSACRAVGSERDCRLVSAYPRFDVWKLELPLNSPGWSFAASPELRHARVSTRRYPTDWNLCPKGETFLLIQDPLALSERRLDPCSERGFYPSSEREIQFGFCRKAMRFFEDP